MRLNLVSVAIGRLAREMWAARMTAGTTDLQEVRHTFGSMSSMLMGNASSATGGVQAEQWITGWGYSDELEWRRWTAWRRATKRTSGNAKS